MTEQGGGFILLFDFFVTLSFFFVVLLDSSFLVNGDFFKPFSIHSSEERVLAEDLRLPPSLTRSKSDDPTIDDPEDPGRSISLMKVISGTVMSQSEGLVDVASSSASFLTETRSFLGLRDLVFFDVFDDLGEHRRGVLQIHEDYNLNLAGFEPSFFLILSQQQTRSKPENKK